MKANSIVALLVGAVLGFFVGWAANPGGKNSDTGSAQAVANPSPSAAPSQPPPPARPGREVAATVYKVPIEGSPVKGSADALVTLVEFSDYQCPFCSRAHNTVQQLEQQYGNKLRVVMKQNPLSFHARAKPAAVAAMAAGEQGKYWEYHDKLFANAKALEDADLERYASELKLDMARWKKDLTNPKFQQIIDRDQTLAGQLGATGTPAFFINGRLLSGAQPIESFKAVIDEELAKAETMVRNGTKPGQVYAAIIEKGQTQAARPAQQQPPTAYRKVDVPADSPSFGPKNAKVTIVEWSDFECPFCTRVNPTLAKIKETYPKDVRVVFRHQPLPFHPNAKLAGEASMAAHEQGKFWEYHDKLFANQKALDRASLEKYAQELKLDMGKFKAALDSGKYRGKVEADSAAGNAVGANGTPTFFINGRQLVGAQPFESFKAAIDEELARANKLLESGTKPENLYAKLMDTLPAAAAPAADDHGDDHGQAEPPIQKVEVGKAPAKGPANAPVTIVAFSDFECPFCSRVLPALKQIEEQYKDKVRIAFKHQPLPFHANAKPAAAASMAAHEQGKFWEYHDKLFANQRALDRASLERYAEELKLDMGKFKAALDSGKYNELIEADSAEGMRVGANGTPTFFINGRTFVGAQPFEAFKRVIDEELQKAAKGGTVAKDTK
jgi:protein-disulfide isomerase